MEHSPSTKKLVKAGQLFFSDTQGNITENKQYSFVFYLLSYNGFQIIKNRYSRYQPRKRFATLSTSTPLLKADWWMQ